MMPCSTCLDTSVCTVCQGAPWPGPESCPTCDSTGHCQLCVGGVLADLMNSVDTLLRFSPLTLGPDKIRSAAWFESRETAWARVQRLQSRLHDLRSQQAAEARKERPYSYVEIRVLDATLGIVKQVKKLSASADTRSMKYIFDEAVTEMAAQL